VFHERGCHQEKPQTPRLNSPAAKRRETGANWTKRFDVSQLPVLRPRMSDLFAHSISAVEYGSQKKDLETNAQLRRSKPGEGTVCRPSGKNHVGHRRPSPGGVERRTRTARLFHITRSVSEFEENRLRISIGLERRTTDHGPATMFAAPRPKVSITGDQLVRLTSQATARRQDLRTPVHSPSASLATRHQKNRPDRMR